MKYIDEYNGNAVEHNIKITHYNDKDYYLIQVLNEDNKEMGFLSFKAYDDYIWIFKLETHEEYRNKGVGSALLNMLEYMAKYKWKNSIEGKFYPDNEFAKPLYEKFGYSFDYELTGQTIFKYISFDKVKEEIAPKVKDFNVIEQQKNEEDEKEM